MGYACPVCSDPQADAGHLANHLAFTAMLGDDDHEAWLEEHAPEWTDMGERELAATVSEDVEATDFPQLFEDTVGGIESETETEDPPAERSGALFEEDGHEGTHGHTHHGHTHAHEGAPDVPGSSAPTDGETERILQEAREMTRRMLDDGDEDENEKGSPE
ncbi:hypothetical protein KM295_06120 [Natronomonas sp. F2-12]|jgi:hypothetical protein|uniref:Uncharacterized protein n=1 Tax=Natronomonas aquatica TaxID=2841590 RepID=A0A9R1CQB0_9EURY|nr:DUF5810 domain-containing protein [Natronomonas aquatica]MCQ4333079.1 hypothetical protein [Natronomonas aquatica]